MYSLVSIALLKWSINTPLSDLSAAFDTDSTVFKSRSSGSVMDMKQLWIDFKIFVHRLIYDL